MNSRTEFIKLQMGSFISQCGSHFLTLALSAIVFSQTGSLIKAGLVFVLSYLPSVFVSSRLGSLIDTHISKKLLIGNECLAILASLLCGFSINFSSLVFCVALSLRSILLFSSRTMTAKWLKTISSPDEQASRIKLSFLMFFLATAVSGLVASRVLGLGSIWIMVTIDVVTYLVGATVFLTLSKLQNSQAASIKQNVKTSLSASLAAIFYDKELRRLFLSILCSQAVFQGAYSVLVNYLPIHHFRLGVGGTGIFQLAASLGIIGGFCFVWKMGAKRQSTDLRSLLWYGGILGLLGSVGLPLVGSFLSFFIVNLCYESIWLDATASFFKNSPSDRVAEFQFTLSSVAAFCMGVATLVYAAAIQTLGTETISYIALFSFVAIGSWHVVVRDRNTAHLGGLGQ